jgi:Fe-S cluster assembly iron-binding protein IscA
MDTTTSTAPVTSSHAGEAPDIVSFTPKAVEMVRAAIEQEGLSGQGIRVGVAGGGCSGFQYTMDFE